MAFYLGSFSQGIMSGAKDVVGMFDTAAQTEQRREETKALKQDREMKQKAFDDVSKANQQAADASDEAQRLGTMNQLGQPTGTSAAATGDNSAVAPTDLSKVSQQPAHLHALIPSQYGQQQSTAPAGPGTYRNSPIPSDYGSDVAPTSGSGANLPIGSTSGVGMGVTPPVNVMAPAQSSPAAAPGGALNPANAAYRQQTPQPRQNAPTYTPQQRPPSQASPVTPGSPINPNTPTPAVPGSNPMQTGPVWTGQNQQRQPSMMPNLASGQAGMGASILAAMNPTAGASA